MLDYLVSIICDTSFLISLATRRIKNLDESITEIGQYEFVIPKSVMLELEHLINNPKKSRQATSALTLAKQFSIDSSIIRIPADYSIINYIKKYGGIVATLDRDLKNNVRAAGGSIMSLYNDRIILENQ